MKPLKVWINGLTGRVGGCLQKILGENSNYTLLGGASKDNFASEAQKLKEADLIIDFSTPEGTKVLTQFVKDNSELAGKSFLICTTGLEKETLQFWKSLSEQDKESRVMVAPNTSLGILLSRQSSLAIAKTAHEEGFDTVLEETHHRYKKDAPSGTALYLAEALSKAQNLPISTELRDGYKPSENISVHAMRAGGVFGEHSIRFVSDHEEITITHRAFSRDLFANGALFLAKWLHTQKAGFYAPQDVSF